MCLCMQNNKEIDCSLFVVHMWSWSVCGQDAVNMLPSLRFIGMWLMITTPIMWLETKRSAPQNHGTQTDGHKSDRLQLPGQAGPPFFHRNATEKQRVSNHIKFGCKTNQTRRTHNQAQAQTHTKTTTSSGRCQDLWVTERRQLLFVRETPILIIIKTVYSCKSVRQSLETPLLINIVKCGHHKSVCAYRESSRSQGKTKKRKEKTFTVMSLHSF